MEEQFCATLEGVLRYEQRSQMIAFAMFAGFLLVFGIIAICKFKKARTSDKIVIAVIGVVLCVIGVAYPVYCHKSQADLRNDIANEAFVTYHGEFVHDDYQKDSFYHNVVLHDGTVLRYPDYGNHYNLHDSKQIMPVGTFTGTIVYSHNSRIVVSWAEDE